MSREKRNRPERRAPSGRIAAVAGSVVMAGSLGTAQPGLAADVDRSLDSIQTQTAKSRRLATAPASPRLPSSEFRTTRFGDKVQIHTNPVVQDDDDGLWAKVTWVKSGHDLRFKQVERQQDVQRVLEAVKQQAR